MSKKLFSIIFIIVAFIFILFFCKHFLSRFNHFINYEEKTNNTEPWIAEQGMIRLSDGINKIDISFLDVNGKSIGVPLKIEVTYDKGWITASDNRWEHELSFRQDNVGNIDQKDLSNILSALSQDQQISLNDSATSTFKKALILSHVVDRTVSGDCVAHAQKLLQLYKRYGLKGRMVNIWFDPQNNFDAHTLTEVYRTREKTWVLVDPTFDAYYSVSGEPACAYDVHYALISGKSKDIVMCRFPEASESSDPRKYYVDPVLLFNYFEINYRGLVLRPSYFYDYKLDKVDNKLLVSDNVRDYCNVMVAESNQKVPGRIEYSVGGGILRYWVNRYTPGQLCINTSKGLKVLPLGQSVDNSGGLTSLVQERFDNILQDHALPDGWSLQNKSEKIELSTVGEQNKALLVSSPSGGGLVYKLKVTPNEIYKVGFLLRSISGVTLVNFKDGYPESNGNVYTVKQGPWTQITTPMFRARGNVLEICFEKDKQSLFMIDDFVVFVVPKADLDRVKSQ